MNRRNILKGASALAVMGTMAGVMSATRSSIASSSNPVIKITAQRFNFTPDEIVLRSGQAAVLEITSLDFVHGFKIPDLGIRTDLLPGRVTTIPIRPLAPGRYIFLCDNFCGGGHEDMNGALVVSQ
ncbi:MAG: cupredoxin domain-containing protein [Burkholderiales bacterium]|jgi:cytochrome c oxidase subunit 2